MSRLARLTVPAIAATAVLGLSAAASADAVRLKAAGSLRPALGEISTLFTERTGIPVEAEFAPSGLLRERIEGGEPADLFASANMAHPRAIAEDRGGTVVPFARNRLCALAQPDIEAIAETLLDRMLEEGIRLGTSTPGADPSGDYAWELFDKAEAVRPGAAERLKEKALTLTGGPDSPEPPPDRSIYGLVMEEDRADLFLTYCTNAVIAAREVPGLQVIQIPETLSVGADYGLIVLNTRAEAQALADLILSDEGQTIMASYGFGAPP